MIEIGQELYNQQRHPRFGTSNPERMRLAFWEWMIRGENSPLAEDKRGLAQAGWSVQDGKLKSTYGPYRARQHFSVPISCEDGPIWTFERMGRTQTQLPDGRIVCVGGEHEDFYDPDFFIYNDVVVLGPQDELEIYGYPKEVFPPTDFHTATLLEDEFVIVGGLGYKGERRFGFTPVYRLDLSDYHIEELRTSSEMPGWIFQHTAHLDGDTIVVRRRDCSGTRRGGALSAECRGVRTRHPVEPVAPAHTAQLAAVQDSARRAHTVPSGRPAQAPESVTHRREAYGPAVR